MEGGFPESGVERETVFGVKPEELEGKMPGEKGRKPRLKGEVCGFQTFEEGGEKAFGCRGSHA